MPHRTSNLTPGQRLAARLWHYVAFTVVFLLIYGGIIYELGYFPQRLLFGILLVSLAKDLFDEYRLLRGRQPLVYGGIEHAPSNVILIAFILTDLIILTGSFQAIPLETWALGLAGFDLLLDLSQDLRA
jgi:hypothetical protein